MVYSGELLSLPGNSGEASQYDWQASNFLYRPGLEPGSAEWWLAAGIIAIQQKQDAYCMKEMYVNGPHPAPNGDHRYVRALRDLQDKTKTNFISLVVNSPIQRMRFKGIRFGDNTRPDPEARKIWSSNDMDYQMEQFLVDAATYGESYMLVGPDDIDTGLPTLTTESPRVAHVFPDPVRPTKSLAGIRLWKDVFLNRVVAVVYTPTEIVTYVGPTNTDATMTTVSALNNYQQISSFRNELGEVPLVRAEWRPGNRGEADDVFTIQDRINHTVLDRLLISKQQAYNQRWGTGVSMGRKGKKGSAPPWEPGADMLWITEDEKAKFGQFEAADLTQLIDAVKSDIINLASITQTPAHYLMGTFANVGGDTLTQAESTFVAKLRMRQRAVGWAIERAIKLALKQSGNDDLAKDVAEVVWADPEVRSRAEEADAALKEAQVFAAVPPFALAVIAERMGLEPDQIEELVVGAEEWQKEQLAREEKMLDKQTDGAVQVAKVGSANRPKPKPKTSGSSGS